MCLWIEAVILLRRQIHIFMYGLKTKIIMCILIKIKQDGETKSKSVTPVVVNVLNQCLREMILCKTKVGGHKVKKFLQTGVLGILYGDQMMERNVTTPVG